MLEVIEAVCCNEKRGLNFRGGSNGTYTTSWKVVRYLLCFRLDAKLLANVYESPGHIPIPFHRHEPLN